MPTENRFQWRDYRRETLREAVFLKFEKFKGQRIVKFNLCNVSDIFLIFSTCFVLVVMPDFPRGITYEKFYFNFETIDTFFGMTKIPSFAVNCLARCFDAGQISRTRRARAHANPRAISLNQLARRCAYRAQLQAN